MAVRCRRLSLYRPHGEEAVGEAMVYDGCVAGAYRGVPEAERVGEPAWRGDEVRGGELTC